MLGEEQQETCTCDGSLRFDLEEAAAKLAYEAAQAQLSVWDEQNRNRTSFVNAAVNAGLKPDGTAAKKRFGHMYDSAVLRCKRNTLETKLRDAMHRYAMYEPSVSGYSCTDVITKNSQVAKKLPGADVQAIVSVDDLEPLKWHRWDDPRWADAIADISYRCLSNESSLMSGVGPGEERLEKILGGKVQGSSVDFDIATPDGRTWEVKATDCAYIRTCNKGRMLLAAPMKRMQEIIDQLHRLCSMLWTNDGVDLNDTERRIMSCIKLFLDREADMVCAGEVPIRRFRSFRAAIKAARDLKKLWTNLCMHQVSVAGVQSFVTTEARVIISRIICRDLEKRLGSEAAFCYGDDMFDGLTRRDEMASCLTDAAFEDPDAFFNELYESMDANEVFGHVDGLFVVSSQGFSKVTKDFFSKTIRFRHIGQGVPRFSYSLYEKNPSPTVPARPASLRGREPVLPAASAAAGTTAVQSC